MPLKNIASIELIRVEIQRRIDDTNSVNGYCASCLAPLPCRIEDDGIANWTASAASTARRGCEGFLVDIVTSVRLDFDLPPPISGLQRSLPTTASG